MLFNINVPNVEMICLFNSKDNGKSFSIFESKKNANQNIEFDFINCTLAPFITHFLSSTDNVSLNSFDQLSIAGLGFLMKVLEAIIMKTTGRQLMVLRVPSGGEEARYFYSMKIDAFSNM